MRPSRDYTLKLAYCKIFIAVMHELEKENPLPITELGLIWKKPPRFYSKNGKEGAIRILKEEAAAIRERDMR